MCDDDTKYPSVMKDMGVNKINELLCLNIILYLNLLLNKLLMKFTIIDDDEDTYFSFSLDFNFSSLILNKLNAIRYFFIKMIFDLDSINFKNKLKFLNNLLNIGNIIVDEENDKLALCL